MGRSPSTGRSRATVRSSSSGRSKTSRSGRSAPDSIRLRSSTERTNRSRRCASASIVSAARRTSSLDHATSGSARLPAVARMLASGVRRSCETESSSALLRASLRRAISALVASPRSRSRRSPSASWSAASDRRRVVSGSGGAVPAGLMAQSDPEGAPAGLDRDPDEVAVGGLPRTGRLGERLVGADPACRLVAGRSDERGDDRGGRWRSVARVGQDPLPGAAIEHDPDSPESGIAGDPLDDGAGDRLGAVGRCQQSADGELAGRLDRPPVRLGGTLPTECGEPADGEGDDEDQDEVEQLARVGDREREARLGEQQVVDQERRDGRDDRGHGPAERPDDDHRRRGRPPRRRGSRSPVRGRR